MVSKMLKYQSFQIFMFCAYLIGNTLFAQKTKVEIKGDQFGSMGSLLTKADIGKEIKLKAY